jgi:hypothetical protein
MPAYVPNYEHDVFVSYAHVDNESLLPGEKGWVHTFHSQLETLLKWNLGRPDNFSIWFDPQLRGNDPVTAEILDQLKNSATILIFLSKGYLASKWCQQELELFVQQAGATSGRIFVIELDKIDKSKLPEALRDLRGYPFWYQETDTTMVRRLAIPKPDPNEKQYFNTVGDVAKNLADLLEELRKTIDKPPAPLQPIEQARLGPVFLAEAPGSLKTRRDDVRRYLEQHQVHILPEAPIPFIENPQEARKRLEEDLKKSKLFIQLLNEYSSFKIPLTQYKSARALGITVAQWRDPELDKSNVEDSEHQQFLEGPEVQATGIGEFEAFILRQLKPADTQPKREKPCSDILVFLNASPEDENLKYKLIEILKNYGIGYSGALEISERHKPEDVRKDMEDNLLCCDAVLVLYGDTPVIWVRERLRQVRKTFARRNPDNPLRVLAVYNEPKGKPKDPLDMHMPKLKIIEKPFDEFKEMLPALLLEEV